MIIDRSIPFEWLIKQYVVRNEEHELCVSLKSPKEVIEHFRGIDEQYLKFNNDHYCKFDEHEINENADTSTLKDPKETTIFY